MTIRNMASINMAKVNTLIRKGYLLLGIIMAANMFAANEMRAMNLPSVSPNYNNSFQKIREREGNHVRPGAKSEPNIMDKALSKILSWENLINFIGGAVISGANNYFKWWDYNPGKYRQFGCRGWRSKRFLNGMLQIEVNFNAVRGFFWLLPGTYNFIKGFANEEKGDEYFFKHLHVSWLVAIPFLKNRRPLCFITTLIVVFLLQGFVSLPLTLHIPKINLSISISLDSIICGVAGFFLDDKKEVPIKNRVEKDSEIKEA